MAPSIRLTACLSLTWLLHSACISAFTSRDGAACPSRIASNRKIQSPWILYANDPTTDDDLLDDLLALAEPGPPCIIKVLGVGGGGGNAVNRMIQTRIEGVTFWAINTDAQALAKSLAPNVLNIGRALTRGLGAGGDPAVGAKAALENTAELERICKGADMVFITAGMGGGTGSGAAPVVAEIAKTDCGCLTVGVVTKPFAFEGRRRMVQAEKAIEELRKHVDTVIVVSNDKLLRIVPDNTPVTDAFLVADDILRQGVVGISEIILKTGLVNVDFADVRAVMKDAGTALMGVGTGVGKNRASDAAIAAISSPLLDFPIQKAKRIVFNIVGGLDMGLKEINEASEVIYENADDNANIIFGALVDPSMKEEISITVLACDFDTSVTEAIVSGDDSLSSDERDPNFYKERRKATQSPLGPNASLAETRTAITRGFKKPVDPKDVERKTKGNKGLAGFFRKLLGR
jgi:cell division protein FtsZ